MSARLTTTGNSPLQLRRRISTLLFLVLTSIAGLVLLGLIVMSVRLFEIQEELGRLRDGRSTRGVTGGRGCRG